MQGTFQSWKTWNTTGITIYKIIILHRHGKLCNLISSHGQYEKSSYIRIQCRPELSEQCRRIDASARMRGRISADAYMRQTNTTGRERFFFCYAL